MEVDPLKEIKIIDLTSVVAGPYCSQLLADFGADVVKVESPKNGDMLREFGPPFAGSENYYFLLNNRNKKGITLNLKSEKGLEIFYKLASEADVIIENFRPSVKKKLKIDYKDLKKNNSRIIYASISGFGQSGPYENKAGFDQIAQGMSGLSSVTGWRQTGPVRVGVAIGDSLAGIFAAYGILLAVLERNKSGKGQHVTTSLLEGLVATLGFQAAKFFGTNERPYPQGNSHALGAPYGTFKTKNGYLNIATGSQTMWEKLAVAIGLESLITDERFLTVESRLKNSSELTHLIEKQLAEKTSREWEEILDAAAVANGPILYIDEVFQDPQVLHQEMLLEMNHPTAGRIKTLGFPVNLSRTPARLVCPPPLLGQHTEEILMELGYNYHDIEILRAEGIV